MKLFIDASPYCQVKTKLFLVLNRNPNLVSAGVFVVGGSTAMPSGPMRKQPTWYCACTSPNNVGSSCRHQRSPSLVGARSLKRAHSCARSERISIQVGSGFAPVDKMHFNQVSLDYDHFS